MPVIKKLTLTPEEILIISAAQNSAKIFSSPREKFLYYAKLHNKKERKRITKFCFKQIAFGSKIYLFNGIGVQCGVFENNIKGERESRIFALYEIFLKTPEEKRQGGYKIDFCE